MHCQPLLANSTLRRFPLRRLHFNALSTLAHLSINVIQGEAHKRDSSLDSVGHNVSEIQRGQQRAGGRVHPISLAYGSHRIQRRPHLQACPRHSVDQKMVPDFAARIPMRAAQQGDVASAAEGSRFRSIRRRLRDGACLRENLLEGFQRASRRRAWVQDASVVSSPLAPVMKVLAYQFFHEHLVVTLTYRAQSLSSESFSGSVAPFSYKRVPEFPITAVLNCDMKNKVIFQRPILIIPTLDNVGRCAKPFCSWQPPCARPRPPSWTSGRRRLFASPQRGCSASCLWPPQCSTTSGS